MLFVMVGEQFDWNERTWQMMFYDENQIKTKKVNDIQRLQNYHQGHHQFEYLIKFSIFYYY